MFIRPRISATLPRSFTAIRSRQLSTNGSTGTSSENASVSEQYRKACERGGLLEQKWMQSRTSGVQGDESFWATDEAAHSPWRDLRDHVGPFDMAVRVEAQRAAERQSKYAWIPCNYGAKFVLTAGSLYYSLDETQPYSGIYLVSVAKRRSAKSKKEESGVDFKKSNYTFPYHQRKVLFRANTFAEAVHLADALVEKMIKTENLLATMERYAYWRNEPSTIAQFNLLLRLGANSREQDMTKVTLTMSKGEVCDIITDAVMRFEKVPTLPAASPDSDQPIVQEISSSSSEPHGNFMLSDGLWDLES